MNRDEFDRLLDAQHPSQTPLGGLLDAARGPARPDELAGLTAASAAYLAATEALESIDAADDDTFGPRRHPMVRAIAGATLATKVVAGAALAAAAGGAAVVVGVTGHHSRPAPVTPTVSSSAHSSGGSGAGSAAGSLRSLCTSWLAAQPGARDNARYQVLISAAGTRAEVTLYCRRLVASQTSAGASGSSGSTISTSPPATPTVTGSDGATLPSGAPSASVSASISGSVSGLPRQTRSVGPSPSVTTRADPQATTPTG